MNRATSRLDSLWGRFIGGRWLYEGERVGVEDPATGEILAEVALSDARGVDQAVRAAHDCHRSRALTAPPPAERLGLMMRIANEIRELTPYGAEVLCRESGKALDDARHEFDEAVRYFEYYGGAADKIEGRSIPLGDGYVDWTVREPLGVSAQIVPWNFPVALAARSLAAALATGNAVVVKTPELAPLAASLLAEAAQRAGAPPGAVNILTGWGDQAGAALVRHPWVNQIVFTGSVATGRSILHAAADRIVPSVMELGGKSAGIVCEDAHLDTVLASIRSGIFFNAGQVCSAMSRVLVQESIHDALVDRARTLAESLRPGHGLDNAELTPLISQGQRDRVERLCQAGVDAGARAVTGGRRMEGPGYFMQPTVFTHVTQDMAIANEEIFGPALALTPFKRLDEAIELANATEYGLVGGVFTSDLDRAMYAARGLVAGQVFINEWFAGGVETPFGGMRGSGFGREKGLEALDNYVQTKNVAIRLGARGEAL